MSAIRSHRSASAFGLAMFAAHCLPVMAGELLLENALDSFRPVERWHAVESVKAVPERNELETSGKGRILVNGAAKDTSIPYLMTKQEYGDVRIELEFMVPKGSNSGVYVMGRYEVQILDSFGRKMAGSGDLGGIYERWDPTRPKERQGFEGTPPKENAAKRPGEWQTMEIVFRAPRFDEAGKKLTDATFEKVLVNGVLVQENATTSGPTRSSPLQGDAASGPIAIQGDHGPIAIRSLRVTTPEEETRARLAELDVYWAEVSRAVGEGDFDAYVATCHPDGVLVSGTKRMSQPLATALARWEKDFIATREGKVRGNVEFRFSQRVGDATTAHESGIFRYISLTPGEEPKTEWIRFEGLLVKRGDVWQILMENQIGPATQDEWNALR